MSITRPTTRPRRAAAFTLLEMTMSLTVMSLVFVTVGSVFVLAAKVMPAPDSAEAASVHQSVALSQLIEDLQVARYITEDTANAVTLVVDDRTGDGLPDRLRYAWSGTIGDPLTLSINGSTPVHVADDVQSFAIALATTQQVQTVDGSSSLTTSAEVLLYGHSTLTSMNEREVDRDTQTGQLIDPSLPAGASTYQITRVRFRAKTHGPTKGETYIRLRGVSGVLPDSTIYAEEVLLESTLTDTAVWIDVNFSAPVDQPVGTPTALTVEWITDANSAVVEIDSAGGSGLLTIDVENDPWAHNASQGLLVEVYGTYTTAGPTIEMTASHYTAVQVTLQVGSATAQQVTTRMYREPGVHSAAWDAGMDALPDVMDMDGDGDDWIAQSGGAAGSFTNGLWDVDGQLTSEAVHTFLDPIIVDVVLGATESNRGGAKFQINVDQTGGLAMPIVLRVGQDAAGSHYVRLSTRPLNVTQIEATDLGANLPHVRLLIVPAENAVAMIVNGRPIGTFVYTPVSNTNLRGITSLAEYAYGVFDSVSVRVGGVGVVTTSGAGGSSGSSGSGSTGSSGTSESSSRQSSWW